MAEQLKRMGNSARNMLKSAAAAASPLQPMTRSKAVFRLEDHVYHEYVTTMAIGFQACVLGTLHLLAGPNENPNPNAVFFGMFLPFTVACAYVFRTVAKEWVRHKETKGSDMVQFFGDLSSSMALFLGPMAACLRLLNLNVQGQVLAVATIVFLTLAAFVPLLTLLLRRSVASFPSATVAALAVALLLGMMRTAAAALAATPAEAAALAARWMGKEVQWQAGRGVMVVTGAVQIHRWLERSSDGHALHVKATLAAWATMGCAERAAALLAADEEEGRLLRALLVLLSLNLNLMLLAPDLHDWWSVKYPSTAIRVHGMVDDVSNALTMRTSSALEEEKARSHVRESKLSSRVLELLAVISRKDEVLNSQQRTLQTMETSLLNAQVQQQILTEQLDELKERVDEQSDEVSSSDEGGTAPSQLRRRHSKKEREEKEQARRREKEARAASQPEVRTHKRTLPQGPPTPLSAQAPAADGGHGASSEEHAEAEAKGAEGAGARAAKALANGDSAASQNGHRDASLREAPLLLQAPPPASAADDAALRGGRAEEGEQAAGAGAMTGPPPQRRQQTAPAACFAPGGRERSFSLASTLLAPNVQSALEGSSSSHKPAEATGEAEAEAAAAQPDPRPRKFSERFGPTPGGGGGEGGRESVGGFSSASTSTFSQRTFGSASKLGVIQVKIPLSEQEENLLRLEVDEKEQEVQSLAERVLQLESLLAAATGNKPLPLLPRAGALQGVGQSFRWFRGQGWEGKDLDMKHKSAGSYKIRRFAAGDEDATEEKKDKDKDKTKKKATGEASSGDSELRKREDAETKPLEPKDESQTRWREGAAVTTELGDAGAGPASQLPASNAKEDSGGGSQSSRDGPARTGEADSKGKSAGPGTAPPGTNGGRGASKMEDGKAGPVRLAYAAPLTAAQENGATQAGPAAEVKLGGAKVREERVRRGAEEEGDGEVRYGREEGGTGRIDDFYLLAQLIGMDEAEESKAGAKTLYFY